MTNVSKNSTRLSELDECAYSWVNTWKSLIGLLGDDEATRDSQLQLESLEDRILYDANPLGAFIYDVAEPDVIDPSGEYNDSWPIDAAAEPSEFFATTAIYSEEIDSLVTESDLGSVDTFRSPLARQLVVIDSQVEGFEELISDIVGDENSEIGFDVLRLDQNDDGLVSSKYI